MGPPMSTTSFGTTDAKHGDGVRAWTGQYVVPAPDARFVPACSRELPAVHPVLLNILRPREACVPFARVRGVQSGLLLHGIPGGGKTQLVLAAASELGVPLLIVQPAHVQGVHYGETGKTLAAIFDAGIRVAADGHGAILFLDEIEAYGKRNANPDAVAYNMLLSNLLKLFDRASAHEGGHRLAVVAATNRVDACDDALLSRLGTRIEVRLPTPEGRRAFFEANFGDALAQGRLAPDVNMEDLVRRTAWFTLRDLSQLLDGLNARWLDLGGVVQREWFDDSLRGRPGAGQVESASAAPEAGYG